MSEEFSQKLPPKMTRSQAQLATSYAPGSLFIWEGGKGACLSVPLEGNPIDFSARHSLRDQILDDIRDYCLNWLKRGKSIPSETGIQNNQLLDSCFLDPMKLDLSGVEISVERYIFLRPNKMGYIPAPLNFQCHVCNKVKEYKSPNHLMAVPLSSHCNQNNEKFKNCKWRQIDVVYINWSGNLEGLTPYRYRRDSEGNLIKISKCKCGNDEFKLLRRGNQFSRWVFQCMGCGSERNMYHLDIESYNLLKPNMDKGIKYKTNEYKLRPISVRASPVYYVQSAGFIVYDVSHNFIGLLSPNRKEELLREISRLHNYEMDSLDDTQIFNQLKSSGKEDMWKPYELLRKHEKLSRESGEVEDANHFASEANSKLKNWIDEGIITQNVANSPNLVKQIDRRHNYSRRYDPIRLTIEHNALRKMKIEVNAESENLKQPHPDLCSESDDEISKEQYTSRITNSLKVLGIDEIYLIQNLDMVEYSFGFTRFSPNPITEQPEGFMPVRLLGFPEFPSSEHKSSGRRPIYLIEQQNEAFYFKLDAKRVKLFLQSNSVIEKMEILPSIGAHLIESYSDFGYFLEEFRDKTKQTRSRDISSFVYLLLHTFSHQVMNGISRYSGLELGSLGEVIFPADLAFLVHRRGVTEDLGNLSSMWRDHNAAFLDFLADRHELYCGSGTLCDQRGGACPACIMIPEFSCVAGNQLLSRAALVGGNAPHWDENQKNLVGYFDPELGH